MFIKKKRIQSIEIMKSVECKRYLHDKKVWIVDIQPNGAEEILDTHVVRVHAVDEVLVPSTDNNLEVKESTGFNDLSSTDIT